MSHIRSRTTTLAAAVATFTLLGATITPAHAAEPETVTDGLVTPLSLAVAGDGTAYVTQNFAGTLTRVAPGGARTDLYTDAAGSEVGAVSVTGTDITFATTGGTRQSPKAVLWRIVGDDVPDRLANLYGFERRRNPDARQTYGIMKAGKSCLAKVPRFLRPRGGIVESHPYATALGDGVTYVADAAGNTVLSVDEAGDVRAVAVLPPTRITLTRKLRRENELPRCVVGKTYRAEGVPTDVELGPDGNLYVTSLAGGPEGVASGRIYRIDPDTGTTRRLAAGLVSPVGLAISPTGDAYVSMLFASTILKVPFGGAPEPFAQVPFPGDVEYADGFVYATETDLTNDGTVPPAGRVLRWDTTTPAR